MAVNIKWNASTYMLAAIKCIFFFFQNLSFFYQTFATESDARDKNKFNC